MKEKEAIQLACELLKLTDSDKKSIVFLEELNAYYFTEPVKGGASLIIADNGEVLYADSSVIYEEHIAAFKEGIRTPLDAFKK